MDELEIQTLRTEIDTHRASAQTKREAAHELVKTIKASGTDPLRDKDAFEKVDSAFREADEHAQKASEAETRLQAAMRWSTSEPLPTAHAGHESTRRASGTDSRRMAERFCASAPYQAAKESGTLKSGVALGNLGHIEVATRDETETFLAAQGPHGDLVAEDQQLTPPIGLPRRQIRIMDLISLMTTDSDLIEWAEQVAVADGTLDIAGVAAAQAAVKAYGTAANRGQFKWERRTEPVKRVPWETVATKGNLADQSQLAGLLRTELSNGLLRFVEKQVASGDGAGDNFRGIGNTVGVGALSRDTVNNERRIEAIHRAITKVRIDLEDEPTAIGLHPTTNEAVLFEKDGQGRYLVQADPTSSEVPTLWGFPKVISTVFDAGEATIGRWTWARFWLRAGLAINAYDQHEDFASKGLVLLVAELRAAFKLVQPKAFTVVDQL